eukprot:CAMPEP_0202965374 /NCGR_PEP_ID=MMETSP1396-20130829/9371_1 /ASSEMBLY_ACC=CAM_ASM_000872 /TAXON_ID= /ORGANISM="Pseudokeronopsis sp., Strain Brazil" /LENGTH=103 /DNA_ID=CAMNT_0049688063 /DNA_START=13 /DNA_END=324 /DNA_ORIENTATION=-
MAMQAAPFGMEDFHKIMDEKATTMRLRRAIGFCKNMLEIKPCTDRALSYEEKLNFERCLTENYLVKRGYNYFGKRDFIYLDMYGDEDYMKLFTGIEQDQSQSE